MAGELIASRYKEVRHFSEALCEPLAVEDYVIQSMPDVSPTKWHLAHTSWFFETFVLMPGLPGYRSPDPQYACLFNSYYNAAGPMYRRDRRGLLARPTVVETYAYREHVDHGMAELLAEASQDRVRELEPVVTLGIHHEQQHQELMLTDLLHVFSVNPLHPAYRPRAEVARSELPPMRWVRFDEGLRWVGTDDGGFHYDNEGPRHRQWVPAFHLATRPVTNGEYLEFMSDGGYERPELWLSAGWATVRDQGWKAPLYWERDEGPWQAMSLQGLRPVEGGEPVCHLSYYEADAFARWAGARLPTEAEWEVAVAEAPLAGNLVESGAYRPTQAVPGPQPDAILQLYGDVWEWTQSSYSPYPGYVPAPGALGEYNGKFMCNQYVLRGGSFATSITHIRPTYRNFFPPEARWQFTGLRLARDAD